MLAMCSIGVYGIVLAGWASRGPYSLLGALRSTAQVISYEIAMGLSFVAVFLYAGSLSTSRDRRRPAALLVLLAALRSFLIYLVTMVGETNRIPFDLPEGEGEIVAGHMTEYSSMKFAMFFLAEYINMTTVSGLATTLFLGGWRAPWPISTIWARREQRLVADPLVPDQGPHPAVRLRLVARLAAPDPLRPAHGARLEGPDPAVHRVDPAHRDDPGTERESA